MLSSGDKKRVLQRDAERSLEVQMGFLEICEESRKNWRIQVGAGNVI